MWIWKLCCCFTGSRKKDFPDKKDNHQNNDCDNENHYNCANGPFEESVHALFLECIATRSSIWKYRKIMLVYMNHLWRRVLGKRDIKLFFDFSPTGRFVYTHRTKLKMNWLDFVYHNIFIMPPVCSAKFLIGENMNVFMGNSNPFGFA